MLESDLAIKRESSGPKKKQPIDIPIWNSVPKYTRQTDQLLKSNLFSPTTTTTTATTFDAILRSNAKHASISRTAPYILVFTFNVCVCIVRALKHILVVRRKIQFFVSFPKHCVLADNFFSYFQLLFRVCVLTRLFLPSITHCCLRFFSLRQFTLQPQRVPLSMCAYVLSLSWVCPSDVSSLAI